MLLNSNIIQKLRICCIRISYRRLIGFVFGAFLSYLSFFMMITQMDVSLTVATWLSSVISLFLCFGLAYSKNVQCVTLLMLPQVCSKRGRSMLVAYVFLITLSGPAANIIENIGVLTASLSCGEEQIKTAFREIFQMMKEPMLTIKNAITDVISKIKRSLLKVRKVFVRIKELIIKIVRNIKKAFNFLGKIVFMCNKKMGSPFQRCIDSLERGAADCRKALGPFDVVCKVTELVQPICFNLKILDLMCGLVDFASDSIIDVVLKDLEEFIDRIHKMFYVSVTFTKHSFNFETNSSKSLATIKEEIIADIKKQASLIYIFSYWMDIVSGLMFLWTISKVIRYKRKFLTRNRYDNKYLSKQFRAFDAKRKDLKLETALPLKRKEKRKYVELTSLRLLKKEKFRIARQAFFLFTSTTYMFLIMLTDYSLFWLLSTIRYAAKADDDVELPPFMSVTVGGNGIFVEIVKGIVDAMTPATSSYKIDVTPCLPSPSVPNTDRYAQIVLFITMSWILLVFEPYGLRLRQIIMNQMYPEKANERAAWLCNQIVRKRISFAKFARRKVRQKFRNDSAAKNLSILNFFRVKFNRFWIIRKILGEDVTCTLCAISSKNHFESIFAPHISRNSSSRQTLSDFGKPYDKDNIKYIARRSSTLFGSCQLHHFSSQCVDKLQFVSMKAIDRLKKCESPNCTVKYCEECIALLKGTCPICMNPVQYGDLSDISEELDSSVEGGSRK